MRYSAQLVFGYFIQSCYSETCELRTVTFECASDDEAFVVARKLGGKKEYQFKNTDDEDVLFKFIGITEILKLDVCEDDEVWYSVREIPHDELLKLCRDEFKF